MLGFVKKDMPNPKSESFPCGMSITVKVFTYEYKQYVYCQSVLIECY